MSGTNPKVEEGELPQDNTWYLSGESAKLLNNINLTNGWKTFDGWKIGDTIYKSGANVVMSDTTIAKAAWAQTSISETAYIQVLLLIQAASDIRIRPLLPSV